MKLKKKIIKLSKKVLRLVLYAIIFFIIISFLSVLVLKWIDPFITSIILQRKVNALFSGESFFVEMEWSDYDKISKNISLAVIASEDQNFPFHFGFDVEQIEKVIEQSRKGRRLRGASTITQQLAKNLFLWEDRNIIRKGLEAYFTILLEALIDKKRILEIYLNVIEMDDMIFGVGSACSIFYQNDVKRISKEQAALLAAVIPNPKRFSVTNPSSYILRRKEWIMKQMNSLGGTSYLENL